MGSNECLCNWSNCGELLTKIAGPQTCLPVDHPWRGGFEEIRVNPNSEINVALCKSIFHHLSVPKSMQKQTRLKVALYHWDPKILEQFKKRTTPMTKEQAEQIDQIRNRTSACQADRCNGYSKLLGDNKDNRFVQAPVFTSIDVARELERILVTTQGNQSQSQRQRRQRPEMPGMGERLAKRPNVASSATGISPHGQKPPSSSPSSLTQVESSVPSRISMTPQSKAPDNSILPSHDAVQDFLAGKFNEYDRDVTKFVADDNVKSMIVILAAETPMYVTLTRVFLGGGQIMYPCRTRASKQCNLFSIRNRNLILPPSCDLCAAALKSERQHEQRKHVDIKRVEAGGKSRLDASSKVPFCSLSPESKNIRFNNVIRQKRRVEYENWRLKFKLDESFKVADTDVNFQSMLEKAFASCTGEGELAFKDKVEQTLHKILSSHPAYAHEEDSETQQKDIEEYIERLTETLNRYVLKISGKENQLDYDPVVMRLALSNWMDGKAAYEQLREHSIEVLPSASTLYRKQKKIRVTEGEHARVYGWFKDRISELDGEQHNIGTVYFDELKLVSDFYSNVRDGRVVAFASSKNNQLFNIETECRKLVGLRETCDAQDEENDDSCDDDNSDDGRGACAEDDECMIKKNAESSNEDKTEASKSTWKKCEKCKQWIGKTKQEKVEDPKFVPAVYVNLFRIKTVGQDAMNAEFFFNNGSLTGDDLLAQLLRVITNYELVGVRIYGACSDSGGSNASLVGALRRKKRMSDDFFDPDFVSFLNPCDTERRVFLIACSVHNLKSVRNGLYASRKPGGKQAFVQAGVPFGWEVLRTFFHLDDPNSPETRLIKRVLDLDKYTKMTVSYALIPFEYDTIIFMATQLAKELSCVEQLAMAVRQFDPGYEDEKLIATLEFLRKKLDEKDENVLPGERNKSELQSWFALIEFCIHVHGIYVFRFLNKGACLIAPGKAEHRGIVRGKQNKKGQVKLHLAVDQEKKRLGRYMQYFARWAAEAKNVGEKSFLATVTYRNMRSGVSGFLHYAEAVLREEDVWIVSYLSSSQTTVENVFNRVRAHGRATASKFELEITRQHVQEDFKQLDNSKCYSRDHMECEQTGSITDLMFKRTDEKRDKIFISWIEKRTHGQPPLTDNITTHGPRSLQAVRKSFVDRTKSGTLDELILDFMVEHCKQVLSVQGERWTDILLCDSDFCERARISINGPAESFFRVLSELSVSDPKQLVFDSICQRINEKLISRWLLASKKKGKTFKFNEFVYLYLVSPEFAKLIKVCSSNLAVANEQSTRIGLVVVTQTLARIFADSVRVGIDSHARTCCQEQNESATMNPPAKNLKSEVNRFVGWAIFETYMHYRDESELMDTDEPLDMEADDSEEVASNETCKHPVHYIQKMFIRHEQALLDPYYLQNCYDSVLLLKNNGGLTLVSRCYFEFGMDLMRTIVEAMDQESMEREGDECLKAARARVREQESKLLPKFLSCDQSSLVNASTREEIFRFLVTKAMNARFGMEIEKYKNEQTKRKGRRHKGQSLREGLKGNNGSCG